jgi:ATP-dependent DNA helicase RecQ
MLAKKLKTIIEGRKREKLNSLRVIEKWITGDECKRNMLLKYFGENETSKKDACCSSCQDDLSRFFGGMEENKRDLYWEDELRRLFRQEVDQKV